MNIFFTSASPRECAQALDSLRLNKMILETAQLLSTAHSVLGSHTSEMYKPTHINHPCAKWVRQSDANYNWTFNHFAELLKEYTFRSGKNHATGRLLDALVNCPNCPENEWTAPANCSLFKDKPVFQAYRETMMVKWNKDVRKPTWGKREESLPQWIEDDVEWQGKYIFNTRMSYEY